MATENVIEDLRDWFIDAIAEMLNKVDGINGDEPADTMAEIQKCAASIARCGQELIKHLDSLLIEKKRVG